MTCGDMAPNTADCAKTHDFRACEGHSVIAPVLPPYARAPVAFESASGTLAPRLEVGFVVGIEHLIELAAIPVCQDEITGAPDDDFRGVPLATKVALASIRNIASSILFLTQR